jgi:hypothetical protein
MAPTTLSVKVDSRFARQLRDFCEAHSLNVGKFAEYALREFMEDFHFGTEVQRVLSQHAGKPVCHGGGGSRSRSRK